jgi:hypothetical protein
VAVPSDDWFGEAIGSPLAAADRASQALHPNLKAIRHIFFDVARDDEPAPLPAPVRTQAPEPKPKPGKTIAVPKMEPTDRRRSNRDGKTLKGLA